MLVKQASSFRSIDDLIQNQNDPSILIQLFDKKKKLLALADSGQLTAQKYLVICRKVLSESTNEQIKDSVELEIISAEDDVKGWFKDVLQQTRQKNDEQKKKILKLGGSSSLSPQRDSIPVPQQKKKVEQTKAPSNNPSSVIPNKPSGPLDPSKIFSLKVLDTLMEENAGNKQYYMSLFEQKQKILQLIKQKKLVAQMYLQAIQKLQKSANNQDISFTVQMEIDELKQIHNGNVQQWFKDIRQATEEEKEKQHQKYSIMKTGKAAPKKQNKSNQVITEVDFLTKDIKQRVNNAKIPISNKNLFSFRFLDQEMQKNQTNPKLYCQIFEQKLKFLELIKNGDIDAQGYRDILAQIIQETSNEELKAAAQMEVDLHDVTGDIMQFFQSAIEQTGQKFENQQQLYKKLSGGNSKTLNLNNNTNSPSSKKPQQSILIEVEPKPDISDIVSFEVLNQYLQKYKKDYDYCFELKQKGSKLLKLVEQKKLGPNQYIRLLEKKIQSCKDKQTLTLTKQQLKKFQSTNNASKLFKQILGEYVNKTKIDLGYRTSFDSKIQINEYTINQAEPKIKIQYLLRKLGKHQSLLAYYKNNKLQSHLKQFEQEYKRIKKETLQICQKIKNGDVNCLDIHQYADKNLPNITFSIFHRQSRTSYNENIAKVVQKIKKSNAKIEEYVKGLKKGTNKNNIQEGRKMIEKNMMTIANLEKLKNQDLIPFPLVQQIKTEMYNLDLNKNLTQNQIQVIVTHLDGVRDSLVLKIYMIDRKHPRFEAVVTNGQQTKIDVIIKIPPQAMEQIIRGTQKRYLGFGLYSKGWFSETLVAEGDTQLNFIRTNRMQDKLQMKQGKISLDFIVNVQKPKKPLITEILTIKITQYPKYQHNTFIQNQFLKTIMPFEKPTQSQIVS